MDKHANTSKACWDIIQTLIVKMASNDGYVEPTKAQLVNMCDMGLPCVLPMLESISVLMKFV